MCECDLAQLCLRERLTVNRREIVCPRSHLASSIMMFRSKLRRLPNVGLLLGQRRRQCANSKPALSQRLIFAVSDHPARPLSDTLPCSAGLRPVNLFSDMDLSPCSS